MKTKTPAADKSRALKLGLAMLKTEKQYEAQQAKASKAATDLKKAAKKVKVEDGPISMDIDRVAKVISHIRPFLLSLQNKIRIDTDTPDFSWTNGGCYALAEAISKTLEGSHLSVVAQYDKETKDWVSQHAFVEFYGTNFDYNGKISIKQLCKYGLKCSNMGSVKVGHVDNFTNLWYPDQEFVNDSQIREISSVFITKYLENKYLP